MVMPTAWSLLLPQLTHTHTHRGICSFFQSQEREKKGIQSLLTNVFTRVKRLKLIHIIPYIYIFMYIYIERQTTIAVLSPLNNRSHNLPPFTVFPLFFFLIRRSSWVVLIWVAHLLKRCTSPSPFPPFFYIKHFLFFSPEVLSYIANLFSTLLTHLKLCKSLFACKGCRFGFPHHQSISPSASGEANGFLEIQSKLYTKH